jgi:hypothetical protein
MAPALARQVQWSFRSRELVSKARDRLATGDSHEGCAVGRTPHLQANGLCQVSAAGRPEIGTPINVRLGDDLLAHVDAYTEVETISRAEAIRQLVQHGLRRKALLFGQSQHYRHLRGSTDG